MVQTTPINNEPQNDTAEAEHVSWFALQESTSVQSNVIKSDFIQRYSKIMLKPISGSNVRQQLTSEINYLVQLHAD